MMMGGIHKDDLVNEVFFSLSVYPSFECWRIMAAQLGGTLEIAAFESRAISTVLHNILTP